MITSRTILVKTFVVSFLLALAGGTFSFVNARRTRNAAEAFINNIRRLRVGKSSFQEFSAISAKYQAYTSIATPSCTEKECSLAFEFNNRWLAKSFLSRPAQIGGSMTFTNGALHDIDLGASCGGKDRTYVIQVRQAVPSEDYTGPYFQGGQKSGEKQQSFSIKFTPDATPEEYQRAYAFDLRFLDRLGGCYDANDMLPIFR